MVKIVDTADEQDVPGERARARMSDVLAIQAQLAEARAEIAAMRGELAAYRADADNPIGPLAKARFFNTFFANAAVNNARSAKHFRAWAEASWAEYEAVYTRARRVTMEEMALPPEALPPLEAVKTESVA